MKFKLFSFIILFFTFNFSCEKDKIIGQGELELCGSKGLNDIDELVLDINKYLKNQEVNLSEEEKLMDLKNQILKTKCIVKADILCVSCIKTNPPISEIRIEFYSGENLIAKTLDIRMENILSVIAYHD